MHLDSGKRKVVTWKLREAYFVMEDHLNKSLVSSCSVSTNGCVWWAIELIRSFVPQLDRGYCESIGVKGSLKGPKAWWWIKTSKWISSQWAFDIILFQLGFTRWFTIYQLTINFVNLKGLKVKSGVFRYGYMAGIITPNVIKYTKSIIASKWRKNCNCWLDWFN